MLPKFRVETNAQIIQLAFAYGFGRMEIGNYAYIQVRIKYLCDRFHTNPRIFVNPSTFC